MPEPGKIPARPTTDRARESLFNILTVRYSLEDAVVLDLFAGTGAVGAEFVSRGAAKLVAIEQDAKSAMFIKMLFKKLHFEGAEVIEADVFKIIQKLEKESFDFVFADPPYNLPQIVSLPTIIKESGLLKAGGLFVLEHGKNSVLPSENQIDQREYGQSVFSFYSYY